MVVLVGASSRQQIDGNTINFKEYAISNNIDHYWIWGTLAKDGDIMHVDVIMSYAGKTYDEYIFRIKGTITIGDLDAHVNISGKDFSLNINEGIYYT